MLSTVEGMADVAHLEAGRALELDRAPVDLAAHVRAVTEEVRAGRAGAHVEVDALDATVVAGDAPCLSRVLQHIIGNAVKYRPSDALVRVMIRRAGATQE